MSRRSLSSRSISTTKNAPRPFVYGHFHKDDKNCHPGDEMDHSGLRHFWRIFDRLRSRLTSTVSINVEASRTIDPRDAAGLSGVGVADKALSGKRDDSEQAVVGDDFHEGAAEGLA